jgi:hypothetical protein
MGNGITGCRDSKSLFFFTRRCIQGTTVPGEPFVPQLKCDGVAFSPSHEGDCLFFHARVCVQRHRVFLGTTVPNQSGMCDGTDSFTQVALAPPGTEAATLDIKAAYRTVPVWPPHKQFLVVAVGDDFFIDHVFPFGLSTAGGVQGHVADATVDILSSKDLGPIKKWVDDHTFFRFPCGGGKILADGSRSPFIFCHGLWDIYNESHPLGIPWHPIKWKDFAAIFIYLGFLWNLTNHTVELPDAKRLKYLEKVSLILESLNRGGRLTLKDTMSINGTLSHISFVIPHGRAYLANLSSFIAHFASSSSKFTARHPPNSVVHDLKWWHTVLSASSPVRTLLPRGDIQDLDIWVDASTDWGIGLVMGSQWDAWTLKEGWKGQGRDIGWLEAIAVELVVLTLFKLGGLEAITVELAVLIFFNIGWKDAAILIHSDNQGVIGAFRSGRSRNFQVNLCIRRVETIAMTSNVAHTFVYVESTKNKADAVSRGETGSPSSRINVTQLPSELSPFLLPYVQ